MNEYTIWSLICQISQIYSLLFSQTHFFFHQLQLRCNVIVDIAQKCHMLPALQKNGFVKKLAYLETNLYKQTFKDLSNIQLTTFRDQNIH